ncbi:hypothetical protein DOJK_00190 [Patescibacteria group bacterium]|nr:hypothetical protein DOJK_00190 [Patescibacteria group bacterium]
MKKIFLVFLLAMSSILIWSHYQTPPPQGKADKILVEKSARQLSLLAKNQVLKTYTVSLGFQPEGKKQQEGDGRTPEGVYNIDYKNPNSAYHLSLHVSYPDENDTNNAKQRGVSAGGNIMIHGMKNGFGQIGNLHRFKDWTAGCIAVTDKEMDEIWQAVDEGTVIEIKP